MTSASESFPSERLDDFTRHEWCNALLADPTITQLHKRERPSEGAATRNISNTYFARTLFTEDAVRAFLYLYRPRHDERERTQLTEKPGNLTPDERQYLHEAVERSNSNAEPQTDEPENIVLVSLGRGVESGVDIIHGGITAALLDQTMGRLIWYMHGTFPATAEMTVKYKKPIPSSSVVLCRARVVKDEGRYVRTVAWVEDGKGKVFAEGHAKFLKSVKGPPKAKL